MDRRKQSAFKELILIGCLFSFVPASIGCQSWFKKKNQDENSQFIEDTKRIKKLLADPNRPRLIGEVSSVSGIEIHKYQAYGLVTQLNGTGGIVKPGVARKTILDEMRRHEAHAPEQLLDSPHTALIIAKAFTDPGAQKGDILDIDVQCAPDCMATDLAGGTLLEANLREMAYLGGQVKTSEDKATAAGELVTLPESYTKQAPNPLAGVIVGGGRIIKPRRLSLLLLPEYKHVFVAHELAEAINKRFYFHDSAKQKMVAEGKNNFEVLLTLPPKYQFDVDHFSTVIRTTGYKENEQERNQRLEGCKKLLKDRTTARRAAAELESLGTPEAIEVLLSGLSSIDTEIRFYSAYSLAYLDHKEASPVLAEIAKKEAAFRPLCLVGLSVTSHASGREMLERLLQEPSPELRYGAFLAMRNRDENDMMVLGERLGKNTSLIQIPSDTPLVAVSLQQRPEIVVFGPPSTIRLTQPLSPTAAVSITPIMGNQVRIVKRSSGEVADAIVEAELLTVLRELGALGASYNDFVQTLDQLQIHKGIASPIAFNPRPVAGRIYKRDASEGETESVSLVQVDSKTREVEPKSWWSFPDWFSKSTVTTTSTSTDDRLPITDMDQKSKMVEESISVKRATSTNVGSSDLPDIDWDSLK